MSGNLNEATLIGNVATDLDTRHTQDGRPIVNFNMATNERWKTKDGEWKERADFHRIVCFHEGLCKVIQDHVRKGDKVFVRGRLQTRSWEKDGVKRYTTEVILQGPQSQLVMLDSKPRDGRSGEEAASDAEAREAELSVYDSEMPF